MLAGRSHETRCARRPDVPRRAGLRSRWRGRPRGRRPGSVPRAAGVLRFRGRRPPCSFPRGSRPRRPGRARREGLPDAGACSRRRPWAAGRPAFCPCRPSQVLFRQAGAGVPRPGGIRDAGGAVLSSEGRGRAFPESPCGLPAAPCHAGALGHELPGIALVIDGRGAGAGGAGARAAVVLARERDAEALLLVAGRGPGWFHQRDRVAPGAGEAGGAAIGLHGL